MGTALALAGVKALSEHGRWSMREAKTFIQLRAILDSQPDGGDA